MWLYRLRWAIVCVIKNNYGSAYRSSFSTPSHFFFYLNDFFLFLLLFLPPTEAYRDLITIFVQYWQWNLPPLRFESGTGGVDIYYCTILYTVQYTVLCCVLKMFLSLTAVGGCKLSSSVSLFFCQIPLLICVLYSLYWAQGHNFFSCCRKVI